MLSLLTRCGIASLTFLTTACVGAQYFLANAPTMFGSFERTADLEAVAAGERPRQRVGRSLRRSSCRR